MGEFVVDIQGFLKPAHEFIPKEVAIKSLDDGHELSFIFGPESDWDDLPAQYKSTNTWMIRNYHGLTYEFGSIPYLYIGKILKAILSDASIIYVKGLDKQRFLYNHLEKCVIINLEKIDCTSLKNSEKKNKQCAFHAKLDDHFECSLKNVNSLYSWIQQ